MFQWVIIQCERHWMESVSTDRIQEENDFSQNCKNKICQIIWKEAWWILPWSDETKINYLDQCKYSAECETWRWECADMGLHCEYKFVYSNTEWKDDSWCRETWQKRDFPTWSNQTQKSHSFYRRRIWNSSALYLYLHLYNVKGSEVHDPFSVLIIIL